MNNYIKALTKLKQKGIRPTSQRKVLAKIIFENGNRHLNAEIIYNEAKKLGHSISLATVYNTLKQFSYFGLLKEIVVDQNKSMYCNNREPHYHLYVEDEGKIIDIPNDIKVIDSVAAGDAFSGGLSLGISEELEFEKLIIYGVLSGSIAVQKPGATDSMPTIKEFNSLQVKSGK